MALILHLISGASSGIHLGSVSTEAHMKRSVTNWYVRSPKHQVSLGARFSIHLLTDLLFTFLHYMALPMLALPLLPVWLTGCPSGCVCHPLLRHAWPIVFVSMAIRSATCWLDGHQYMPYHLVAKTEQQQLTDAGEWPIYSYQSKQKHTQLMMIKDWVSSITMVTLHFVVDE